jgi:DNA-binding response OmpR family regulator
MKVYMGTEAIILVVDDEPKIQKVLCVYLEGNGYRALTAGNGKEALRLLEQNPVSLILLDLMLPDIPGEEVCRRIRAISNVPIIMLTAKIEEEYIIQGLSIGADDYVTKPFKPKQLLARIAAVLRRTGITETYTHEKAGKCYSSNNLIVDIENRTVTKQGKPLVLTPNEFKILSLLISRPEKIFTRDEIIYAVKDDSFDGFDRNIDVHIFNLRKKIEDEPKTPQYITTIHGIGYRFGGNNDDTLA